MEAKDKEKIYSCLNLMRRLPPSKINQNTNALIHLCPDLEDELLQRIDQPLEIENDTKTGQKFIKCEYNRDGDSYRSPWSNEYFPSLEEAVYPSQSLRELEKKAHALFEQYRYHYYEGGVSSTYLWDKEDGDFALCFLVKKDVDQSKGVEKGSWDSSNVVDIKIDRNKKKVTYKITSSLILDMKITSSEVGEVIVGGTLTKQKEETHNLEENEDSHLSRIGKLIEDMESNLRNMLDSIYLGKTKEIIFTTRIEDGKEFDEVRDKLRLQLNSTMKKD